MLNEGNQIYNFLSGSGSGTVINYGSGSGSDFLTSYSSGSEGKKLLFLRFRFHNTIPQTVRFFRLPHQQIYTFHQCIFIIYSAMEPLWVFTGYLLLKSALNIRILQIPVTSLSPTYRKVNCLFVLAKYWVPTVQLLFLCLSHSYLPILYNNCLIYTYHLFSFLLGNLPGLPILCAAKMDSFPLCYRYRTYRIYNLSKKLLLFRWKSINISTKRKLLFASCPAPLGLLELAVQDRTFKLYLLVFLGSMSVNSDELKEPDIYGPVVMSTSQDLAFRYRI